MALYRGSTKLAGIGKGFNPENTGTTGQVLTKTDTGYQRDDTQEIEVDDSMSDSSENPVQNKIVKGYIDTTVGNIETLLSNI